MTDPFVYIGTNGPEWAAIKRWLEDQHKELTRKLINANAHDQSNELRGAIKLIEKLLLAEEAAKKQGR